MHRWDIINHFIKKNNYKSYLEIGYFKGWSFDNVTCERKVAVDPNPCKDEYQQDMPYGCLHYNGLENYYINKQTSDEYFDECKTLSEENCYDIIFIDGMHEATQVTRDIENSIKHLSPGGTIVLHDCNPPTYQHTTTGDCGGNWNGDCYKALINFILRNTGGYEVYTIDSDWGVGVIKPKPQNEGVWEYMMDKEAEMSNDEIRTRSLYEWDTFDKYRKGALNLISVEEFLKREKIDEKSEDPVSTA